MGLRKDIKRQAQRAERAATEAADILVADQMKFLAEAFNAQAAVLKRKKKKKKKDELHC
jgi:hypothetical protein